MRVLGVDTDVNGSVAYLKRLDSRHVSVDIFKIPRVIGVRSKQSRTVNFTQLSVMAKFMPTVKKIFLEQQFGRPGQALNSTITFFECYGALQLFSRDVFIHKQLSPNVDYVTPNKWKGDFGLTSDKKEVVKFATQLAPDIRDAWGLVANTSAAEAFLIALWGLIDMGVHFDENINFLPVEKSAYPEQSLFFGLET